MQAVTGNRLSGMEFSSDELANLLNRQARLLKANEGGVTFSGGEPLLQARFLTEVIDQLDGLHVVLDTSGYADPEDFELLLKRVNLVYFDLKLIDSQLHRKYTGRDNDLILKNLAIMSASGVPYFIRVPLVPGVTDTHANLSAIANKINSLPGLVQVDLLPYNRAAGAKYKAAGVEFLPDYDETCPVNSDVIIFEKMGIKVHIT
jgi:pyruvate formate lyase activating enzyme